MKHLVAVTSLERILRSRLWPALCCGALCLLACMGRAAAQQDTQVLASRALFDEGRRLMAAGEYAAACSKFEESQRLRAGIGTEFNLAECYEKLGKTASAWSLFLGVAAETKAQNQVEREKLARDAASALEPRLSRLTILVPSPVSGLSVRLNGAELGPASWGVATPMDPGSYTVQAEAKGHQRWQAVVEVPQLAGSASVEVPALVAELRAGQASQGKAGSARTSKSTPPAVADRSNRTRTAAYVAGAIGLSGLSLGTLFGLKALSTNSEAKKICAERETRCLDHEITEHEELIKTSSEARSAAYLGFGVGAAGMVASGILLLLTKEPARKTETVSLMPRIGWTSLGLRLYGAF